ncbi:MAG: DUF3783 domain-containing protein [Thermodesulfobacteriota bacterium]
MNAATFQKVGASARPMYGPRAMLICGFAPAEQDKITGLVKNMGIPQLPAIFAAPADGTIRLGDLLARPDQSGKGAASTLARAIILSGITESELHRILGAYRQSGLPRPLWATLTPTSENWPLSELLAELDAERRAMENRSNP